MEVIMENLEQNKLKRAKKRIEEIKGFYIHLTVYVVVNIFILINIYLNTDNFWRWPHFLPLFGWGIGVSFHAAKTFGYNPFFGKKWEERQIQKFIDEDKKQMDKFK